jgi:hypothetical protein
MMDTPDDVMRRYEAMLMELPPGRRLAMALGMFATARVLAEAGIRAQGVTDAREIRRRLLLAFHGDDLDARQIEAIAGRGAASQPPR